MNSMNARHAAPPSRRRFGTLVSAVLPLAGLILSTSGSARLASPPVPGAGTAQCPESAPFEWAVIDRIEPGEDRDVTLAVLLLGHEEREHAVTASLVPREASPGSWVRVRLSQGDALAIESIEIDHERTEEARRRVEAKLEALRQRGSR